MKKLLKHLIVLSLAVCCLAAFAACGSPGDEFSGEYEKSDYDYEMNAAGSNGVSINKPYVDANLIKAINDNIAIVGTKVKLNAKEVLFRDSNTKFNVAEYRLSIPEEPEFQIPENRSGRYDITTNDEELIIIISARKANGRSFIAVYVQNCIIGVDGEKYYYYVNIRFESVEK
ncbi:MAG: hypothetical protein FWG51_01245 [Firmicutes bacterium]|nr:hypothetical protein [Bacillota bacterium]